MSVVALVTISKGAEGEVVPIPTFCELSICKALEPPVCKFICPEPFILTPSLVVWVPPFNIVCPEENCKK